MEKEFKQLREALIGVSEKYRYINKKRSRHEFIVDELRKETNRKDLLDKKLKKEKRDIDKMEAASLKALFHRILGNAVTQKEKERQEYLAAKLQYDQCCDQIDRLEKEEKELSVITGLYDDIKGEYFDLLKKKEHYLLNLNSSLAGPLIDKDDQITEAGIQLKEVGEAITAGTKLKGELDLVMDRLRSASNWGTWDMLGGGVVTTMFKRSNMDNARDMMHNVQYSLMSFNKELGDIHSAKYEFEFGGFTHFADYFFDGLIVDWIVQSGINKAKDNTIELYQEVEKACVELSGREKTLKDEISGLRSDRESLIESI